MCPHDRKIDREFLQNDSNSCKHFDKIFTHISHAFKRNVNKIKKSRPISRILSFLRTDHHPSSSAIACRIKRPTR